jgi:hypothetical protein
MLFSTSVGSENTGIDICYWFRYFSILEMRSVQEHTGYKAEASLDRFCRSAKARPMGNGLLDPPKLPLPPPLPPRPPRAKPRDIAG